MMRNRKLRNQILVFLCVAVTLLTVYTMMELEHFVDPSDHPVFEPPVPPPKNKAPRANPPAPPPPEASPQADWPLLDFSLPDLTLSEMPPPDLPMPNPEAAAAETSTTAATTTTAASSTISTTSTTSSSTTTKESVNGVVPTPMWTSNMSQPFYIYPKPRNDTSVAVTIVIVMVNGTPRERYETARQSVECYAALHGYNISVFYDDRYPECGVHRDIFFKRHCNVHLYMKEHIQENSWLLFIDGDVGVVNPRVLIEDYIKPGYEIYLFDRFWNWEFAALSYLVKNNKRGRGWVNGFATFEFQLPKSHHGTDNGALHPFMMFYLVPETRNATTRSRMSDLCLSIWNRSRNWDDVFAMEACVRTVIGERINFPEYKVKIYPKGYGWSRDLWTLHSHWTDDDFMMHAVKEKDLTPYPEDENERQACHISTMTGAMDGLCGCIFPVLNRLNLTQCEAGDSWLMEGRLQIEPAMKRKILDRMANQILRSQMNAVGGASGKILNV